MSTTYVEQIKAMNLPKAQERKMLKALGIEIEVEMFERFDFTVESGTNKGKTFPMLMVNSPDGRKHKAIAMWIAQQIVDNADEFILAFEAIKEGIEGKSN